MAGIEMIRRGCTQSGDGMRTIVTRTVYGSSIIQGVTLSVVDDVLQDVSRMNVN